jgi:regulator of nucleoside diphosphate kinase
MNSRVLYVDETTGERRLVQIVYPTEADASDGKVSILAPVGAALLGLSVGQAIEWDFPDGTRRRLRVEDVSYQPESAGHRGALDP